MPPQPHLPQNLTCRLCPNSSSTRVLTPNSWSISSSSLAYRTRRGGRWWGAKRGGTYDLRPSNSPEDTQALSSGSAKRAGRAGKPLRIKTNSTDRKPPTSLSPASPPRGQPPASPAGQATRGTGQPPPAHPLLCQVLLLLQLPAPLDPGCSVVQPGVILPQSLYLPEGKRGTFWGPSSSSPTPTAELLGSSSGPCLARPG